MFGDIIGFNGEAYQVMSAEELAAYDIADEEEFVDPAALESDSVASYIAEHDVTEDDFTGNNTVEQGVTDVHAVEEAVVEAVFIAPTPVAKPAVDSIPADIWEQPEKKKKKKAEAKPVTVAAPKPVEKKKKGRAAPFSF